MVYLDAQQPSAHVLRESDDTVYYDGCAPFVGSINLQKNGEIIKPDSKQEVLRQLGQIYNDEDDEVI